MELCSIISKIYKGIQIYKSGKRSRDGYTFKMKEQNKLKYNTLTEEIKFSRGMDLEKPIRILMSQELGIYCFSSIGYIFPSNNVWKGVDLINLQ